MSDWSDVINAFNSSAQRTVILIFSFFQELLEPALFRHCSYATISEYPSTDKNKEELWKVTRDSLSYLKQHISFWTIVDFTHIYDSDLDLTLLGQ